MKINLVIAAGAISAALLSLTNDGSAFTQCHSVGAQAGVPYNGADWANGSFTYYFDAVYTNYASGNHLWQISVPINSDNVNYTISGRFGHQFCQICSAAVKVGGDAIAVSANGTWYAETGNVYACMDTSTTTLGTIGVPSGGTLMTAFDVPGWCAGSGTNYPSRVDMVSYCY